MTRTIEGVFDGQNMMGKDNKTYPIPSNYASKSKLIEGDLLKLTITENGDFLYKQIGPVKNQRAIGTLIESEDNRFFQVIIDGKKYNVLSASITFFKAIPGDELVVMVPANPNASWAAVDNIIRKNDWDKEL